jgi:hypothetical protein
VGPEMGVATHGRRGSLLWPWWTDVMVGVFVTSATSNRARQKWSRIKTFYKFEK